MKDSKYTVVNYPAYNGNFSFIIYTDKEKIFIPSVREYKMLFHGEQITTNDIDDTIKRYTSEGFTGKKITEINLRLEEVHIYRQQHLTSLLPLLEYFTGNKDNSFPTFLKKGERDYYSVIIGNYSDNWEMRISFACPNLPSIDLKKIKKQPINDQFIGMGCFCNGFYRGHRDGLDWYVDKA